MYRSHGEHFWAEWVFERFHQFISNVSPRTIQRCRESFAWLDKPEPSNDELKALVIRMREHGLKPASCNNRIRALNAYRHLED